MAETVDSLKKQVSVLEQKIALYENEELEKEGYYALKGLVKQQIDIIKEFKLSEEIIKNPKDDKYYDRVKAVGEGLKSMITDLKLLRSELKITFKEEKDEDYKRKQIISPESISNVLGNTAGQQD